MKKRIAAAAMAALLLAAVLSGCGGGAAKSANTGPQSGPIKLALSPWPGWFVWYLVQEKGFFQKNGVQVELVYFPVYSDSLAALATGQVHANSQTLSDTLAPASKNIKLKAVLVNDNSNGGDGVVVNRPFNRFRI